jgi:hypothetical protein
MTFDLSQLFLKCYLLGWSLAQVVEHLLHQHKTLRSNSSAITTTTKKTPTKQKPKQLLQEALFEILPCLPLTLLTLYPTFPPLACYLK